MKALITGGAGFVGSHLAEALLGRGDEVHVIDNLSTGSIENVEHLKGNPRFHYTIDTVLNEPVLAELVDRVDVVFHLAAAVGVRLIVESPVNTIETNVHGTEMVLKLANKKRKKVLLTSTSEVYGKANAVPFREDGDLVMGPTSKGRWSYACSKAIDEFLGLAYHKEKRLPVVVARLFNTVGPRQTGRYGMVIPNFVKQALLGHPLTVFGDGTQTRCFTYVTDVVGQLVALAEEPRAVGEVLNVGNDREEVTILDLARRVRPAHRLEERDRARALRPRLRGGLRGHAAPGARPLEAAGAHRLRAEGAPRRDPRPRRRLLHLRRDPPVKPAEYRRMYEAEEAQWWYAGQRAIATALLEPALAAARRSAPRLLDAGCGTGFNLLALSRLGRAMGIDLAPEAIAFCRERGVRAVRASLLALPFPDAAFDAVTSFDVIYHAWVTDDRAAVAEMARVLRPGGVLLVRVPALRALWGAHDVEVQSRHRYTRGELVALLEGCGLRVERATYCNSLLFPLLLARRTLDRLLGREGSDVGFLPAPLEWAFARALLAEAALVRGGALLPDRGERRGEGDPEGNLAASAVSGQAPPAGPQWVSRLAPLKPQALAFDKPLCASLEGFTLYAATRAGAVDPGGAGGAAALRAASSGRAGASGAASLWPGADHPEEGEHRRNDRGGHGPAVAVLPAGHQRASSAAPHREVRGSAGAGEPVEVARRAAIAPPSRSPRGDKPGRADLAGGYRPWAERLARTSLRGRRGGVAARRPSAWGPRGR